MAEQKERGINRPRLSCGNFAHGFAAAGEDKEAISHLSGPNIGIVTAYNDMLSAHQPYGRYPEQMKIFAREVGATAQVAGGVPAMCDGVTQGQPGMDLSLFSRDVIAMGTAMALSHGMFDAAALLGICDKIVPGLLIGALRFGHLPMLLVPGGPMPSGLPNKEKQRIRQLYAEGKVGKDELLKAESRILSRAGHLHLLRHRQLQPDDDGADGAAHSQRRLHQSRDPAPAGADPSGGASAGEPCQERRAAAEPGRRRESDRQRHVRPARDGRLDQPFHPSAGDRARGRRSSSTGRISPTSRTQSRLVARDLSERRQGRERFPGRRAGWHSSPTRSVARD